MRGLPWRPIFYDVEESGSIAGYSNSLGSRQHFTQNIRYDIFRIITEFWVLNAIQQKKIIRLTFMTKDSRELVRRCAAFLGL